MLLSTLTDDEAVDLLAFQADLADQLDAPPPDAIFIAGYAVLWDAIDLERDRFQRGAFRESLKLSRGARGVLLHWQHVERWPVGRWITIVEDEAGLLCRGAIYPRLAPSALIDAMQAGMNGLSPGLYIRAAHQGFKGRRVKSAYLTEVSVGQRPAQPAARFRILNHLPNGRPEWPG